MPYIAQVAVGRREKLQVFGDDYPTPGRHGGARLHPRRGPGRRPRGGAEQARHDRPAGQHLEPRHRPWHQRARSPALVRARGRARAARTRWSAAGPATSPTSTPTRRSPMPSSAGGPPAPSTTCAPTPGTGSEPPRTYPDEVRYASPPAEFRPTRVRHIRRSSAHTASSSGAHRLMRGTCQADKGHLSTERRAPANRFVALHRASARTERCDDRAVLADAAVRRSEP